MILGEFPLTLIQLLCHIFYWLRQWNLSCRVLLQHPNIKSLLGALAHMKNAVPYHTHSKAYHAPYWEETITIYRPTEYRDTLNSYPINLHKKERCIVLHDYCIWCSWAFEKCGHSFNFYQKGKKMSESLHWCRSCMNCFFKM